MENVLQYKGFLGTVQFLEDEMVFFGKLAGVTDLVTFEGTTVQELVNAFHEAVDDYIGLCEEAGKEPMKSFKGSFNVRITPELHREAYMLATMKNISLNQFIQESLKKNVEVLRGVLKNSGVPPSGVPPSGVPPKGKLETTE